MCNVGTQLDTSQILRSVMHDQRMTHKEFAQYAEVTATQVGRWARGESMPRPRKLAAAIERLGIDPGEYGLRPTGMASIQQQAAAERSARDDEIAATLFEINAKLDRILRALQQHRPR